MEERWTDDAFGWGLRLEDTLEKMGTAKAKLKLKRAFWDGKRSAFVKSWIEQQERNA